MEYNPQVFREYDIRGYVDKDLSEEFARNLGYALGYYAHIQNSNRHAIIGWDCRESSTRYAAKLAEALAESGFNVDLIGMVPTPVVYHGCHKLQCGLGVAVTGSHNPKDMNGFKIVVRNRAISGKEIQEVRQIFEKVLNEGNLLKGDIGSVKSREYLSVYVDDLVENIKPHLKHTDFRFALDYGNGVAAITAIPILQKLDLKADHLFNDPDPEFPNHHPDPTVEKNLEALKLFVREKNLDFGFAFDGDGDRIGLVDNKGRSISGDLILLILATDILKKHPKSPIVGDVKCSDILFTEVQRLGGVPVMWKTGHSLIKAKMKEIGAPLAGEMSGHIFIADRYYGFDDAVYVALRLLEIFAGEFDLEAFEQSIPKIFNTSEIRITVPEQIKFLLIDKLKDAFKDYEINTIDGVRVKFNDGWALIRASNTQPALIMRFEANSRQRLEEIKSFVENLVFTEISVLSK
ncbi:MAG: phosphomannomutase/phosphoglucomutase [Deltaproteobacteria bacterium]|nr:phosphomannomutase/phosphoglucomutase [Deltaproteobacteria bacterium]